MLNSPLCENDESVSDADVVEGMPEGDGGIGDGWNLPADTGGISDVSGSQSALPLNQNVSGLNKPNIDTVTTEHDFPSGEPGFNCGSEAMNLGEEPLPGTNLDAITKGHVFPSRESGFNCGSEAMNLGEEPLPGTNLDAVTKGHVFPSREPGFNCDSEAMNLEEPLPGTNLDAITSDYVFPRGVTVFNCDSDAMSSGEEPLPGTNLDAVTSECVFTSGELDFECDKESMHLGEEEPDNRCSICLDRHTDCALIPCGHYGCSLCIAQWRMTLRPAILMCHICRQVVKEVLPF